MDAATSTTRRAQTQENRRGAHRDRGCGGAPGDQAQRGSADEQKSVARQIDHARQYAQRKGWTVADEHVYVDDGISGAEFANRPGFLRLMNALKPRPGFQVLIMSEESRLGREAIETAYALKQLVQAGVRVFFYLTDTERTLNSPMEKAMLAIQAMSDEMEREKARMRVHDAMVRKAKARHVTGGSCFGYRNVDVTTAGPDRRLHRQYVRRDIIPEEAAVVRRIFELCAAAEGLKCITKRLNAEAAPSPRSQRARPWAWAPSSVREVLHRELYRGTIVWNRTTKRDRWGQKRPTARPVSEWLRVPAEELRIVSDALWHAAHKQVTERRVIYSDDRVQAVQALDPRGSRQSYLLSGFARCACCGGSMQAVSRPSTTGRLFRYVCGAYVNRGETVCANRRMAVMDVADTAIREHLAREVLRPAVLERALERAVALLRSDDRDRARLSRQAEITKRLAVLDRELDNLAESIARDGSVPALITALSRKDAERRRLADELSAARQAVPAAALLDPRALRQELRRYLDDWQALTRANVMQTRQLLTTVLRERIVFTPITRRGALWYELKIPIALDRLLVSAVPSLEAGFARVGMASPTGVVPEWSRQIPGEVPAAGGPGARELRTA